MSASSVDEGQLGRMKSIAVGGFGEVFELLSFALSDLPAPLAFKKFTKPMTAADLNNLSALITYRDRLGSSERDLLDELSTWPLRLVTKRGAVVGLLMRFLEDDWFQHIRFGSVDQNKPRDASWLLGDSPSAARVGVEVPPPGGSIERLVLCAKLARVLALLHRGGFVYGDLSGTNVVFKLKPKPALMLIDCDAVRMSSLGALRQAHQPAWVPPEGDQAAQTSETDCFKLTIFIIRCLADGSRSILTQDPERARGALDDDGVKLLRQGKDVDPAGRPTAKEIYSYLWNYLSSLTEPPQIVNVTVNEQVVLRGTTIKVRCEARGTDSITLRGSDGFEVTHDVTGRTNVVDFSITRSGPITISARNDHGSAVVGSPPVMVFSPPQLSFVNIPEPPIPYTALGAERRMSGAIVSALEAATSRASASVSLPPLPSVLLDDPATATPHLTMEAVDVNVIPMLAGLSRVMDGLTDQAEAISRALSTPLPGDTDVESLMSATLPPQYRRGQP